MNLSFFFIGTFQFEQVTEADIEILEKHRAKGTLERALKKDCKVPHSQIHCSGCVSNSGKCNVERGVAKTWEMGWLYPYQAHQNVFLPIHPKNSAWPTVNSSVLLYANNSGLDRTTTGSSIRCAAIQVMQIHFV